MLRQGKYKYSNILNKKFPIFGKCYLYLNYFYVFKRTRSTKGSREETKRREESLTKTTRSNGRCFLLENMYLLCV